MPTIKQLPLASAVQASDLLPVSQGGTTRGLTIGALLSSTQPALTLASGKLLGRVSAAAGGPEPVGLGTGVSMVSGAIVATGADHLALPVAPSLSAGDEVVVNSNGAARRMAATGLRALFSAGSGVAIDANGQISTGAGSTPATATTLGSVKVGAGLAISASGVLTADGSVLALRSTLAAVATSGAYQDLSGRPSLGQAAGMDVGTAGGTVAAGDDSRILGALPATTAAATYLSIVNAAAQYQTAAQVGAAIAAGTAANVSGTVQIGNGGTGATTAASARTNLGLGNAATASFGTTAGTVADGGMAAAASQMLAAAITVGGAPLIGPQTVVAVSAAGSTQSDGTVLGSPVNVVQAAGPGAGVVLQARAHTVVVNRGANPVSVYPPVGGVIEGQAANAPVRIPAGASATFVSPDTINYYAT